MKDQIFFLRKSSSAPCKSPLICRRGSRISARGGRQGIDDLIWDGDERFLTYANTYLQLFKMFIAILCLNGVEQPFKRLQCPFFLPLRRRNPRLRRGSLRPRGGRPPQRPPPPGSAPDLVVIFVIIHSANPCKNANREVYLRQSAVANGSMKSPCIIS